jgi:hypothetical protein
VSFKIPTVPKAGNANACGLVTTATYIDSRARAGAAGRQFARSRCANAAMSVLLQTADRRFLRYSRGGLQVQALRQPWSAATFLRGLLAQISGNAAAFSTTSSISVRSPPHCLRTFIGRTVGMTVPDVSNGCYTTYEEDAVAQQERLKG